MSVGATEHLYETQAPVLGYETVALNYDDWLERQAAAQTEALNIPDEVVRPTLAIIGRLSEIDSRHNLKLAQEAREVLLVALELGGHADASMGVHTNEAAVYAAAATHDGGKARIAEKDPGILIRSQDGGFTQADYEALKEHVFHSADMVRETGMPLIPVELFPGGVVQPVDIAKAANASHDKQIKGSYLFGPELNWAERRVRDYATVADQALAMLFRDNDFNRHMSPEERWDWVEQAVTYVFNDYWYPPNVVTAVMSSLRGNELIEAKLAAKYRPSSVQAIGRAAVLFDSVSDAQHQTDGLQAA